jgi:hypothetical protein
MNNLTAIIFTVIYWQNSVKQGFNPTTNQSIETARRQLFVNFELPMNENYSTFVKNFLE